MPGCRIVFGTVAALGDNSEEAKNYISWTATRCSWELKKFGVKAIIPLCFLSSISKQPNSQLHLVALFGIKYLTAGRE